MKARPTQSRKGVKGGLRPFSSAPCRVKGQRPLWGLGQRPNCSASNQSQGSHQQRRRQRSVPASNFARPQTRPRAALPPRFREEPKFAAHLGAFSFGNSIKLHTKKTTHRKSVMRGLFHMRQNQGISRRPQLSHSTISPLADVTRLSTADGSDILHPLHWLLISRASGGVMRFLIS